MDLKSQKNIAARLLKCGRNRVWLDPARMDDISDAITSEDIRKLIKDGVIKALPKRGISNYRTKKRRAQKAKGRRKGAGSRKGKLGTRASKKDIWMRRIRTIRKLLKELRDKDQIEKSTYRKIYMEAKSGFFRNKSHLMTYIERNHLLKNVEGVKENVQKLQKTKKK